MKTSYNIVLQCETPDDVLNPALTIAEETILKIQDAGHKVHVAIVTFGGAMNVLAQSPSGEQAPPAPGKVVALEAAAALAVGEKVEVKVKPTSPNPHRKFSVDEVSIQNDFFIWEDRSHITLFSPDGILNLPISGEKRWNISGEDFPSLTPSIFVNPPTGYHGYFTNGAFTPNLTTPQPGTPPPAPSAAPAQAMVDCATCQGTGTTRPGTGIPCDNCQGRGKVKASTTQS